MQKYIVTNKVKLDVASNKKLPSMQTDRKTWPIMRKIIQ